MKRSLNIMVAVLLCTLAFSFAACGPSGVQSGSSQQSSSDAQSEQSTGSPGAIDSEDDVGSDTGGSEEEIKEPSVDGGFDGEDVVGPKH